MNIETKPGIYLHAAYATDDQGTDFSLTYFDGAVYVGNYTDTSSTDSMDYLSYNWQVLGADVIPAEDIEDDIDEDAEPIELAEVEADVEEVTNTQAELAARTINNNTNIQGTQETSDQGLGNVNLLVGTNQGALNWSSTATLSEVLTPIYTDDQNDAINTLHAIMTGADTLTYDSAEFIEYVDANSEENTYTLSYDLKVSNISANISISVPGVIDFVAPSFETNEDEDLAGTWVHFTSTAELIGSANSDLTFTYTGSANDTVDIANLKIEAGAMATPWRASLEEIEGIANTALTTANTIQRHFWTDNDGAHVTEVTRAEYEADPATAGGNTLITSNGMAIRNGTDTLALFTGNGINVGHTGGSSLTLTPETLAMITAEGARFFKVDATNSSIETSAIVYQGDGYLKSSIATAQLDTSGVQAGANLLVNGLSLVIMLSGSGGADYPTNITFTTSEGTTVTRYTYLGWQLYCNLNDFTIAYGTSSTKTVTYTLTYDYNGLAETVTGTLNAIYDGASTISFSYTATSHTSLLYMNWQLEAVQSDVVVVRTPSLTFGTRSGTEGSLAATFGEGIIASADNQVALGQFNEEDVNGSYVLIAGNGTAENARSNALTVDWSGNIETAGTVTVGADPVSALQVATKQYVDNNTPTAPHIEYGEKALGTVAANTEATANVTFSSRFTANPTILTAYRGSTPRYVTVGASNPSTTGCTVRAYNSGTARAITVAWLAIGV